MNPSPALPELMTPAGSEPAQNPRRYRPPHRRPVRRLPRRARPARRRAVAAAAVGRPAGAAGGAGRCHAGGGLRGGVLAEEHKLKADPRVTRLGKWRRKLSLGELPQLVNVLRGELSVVGPRMISPEEHGKYGRWDMNLLTVKPGITGLWQVSGRSEVSYDERVRLDMNYIRNWTIWQDLHILLKTVPAAVKGRGAY